MDNRCFLGQSIHKIGMKEMKFIQKETEDERYDKYLKALADAWDRYIDISKEDPVLRDWYYEVYVEEEKRLFKEIFGEEL